MLEAGYDRSFADRAISYSADKMWYPSVSELEAQPKIPNWNTTDLPITRR
jgi:hypothetical protein